MEKFLINAVRWLKGQQKGKVGVSPQVKALGNLLTKHEVAWTSTTLPTRDLSVYCCASLHNMNVRKVEDFVAEGGGILIGSRGSSTCSTGAGFGFIPWEGGSRHLMWWSRI
uniref:Uncharacterized protein n=1 Tax=Oryctolagus cuniculus TaxID=9986 RepID=A0A5F9DLB7_RABIT